MMRNRSKWFVVALIFLVVTLLIPWGQNSVYGLEGGSGLNQAYPPPSTLTPISPPPTLTPVPPTPTPTSLPETDTALQYIAAREGVPVERLFVVNQHRREYGLLGRAFWFVKALDQQSGHFYTAMVDLDDRSVAELEEIERAQREAREARYGKLEPQLYELLQTKGTEDEVKVAIWFTSIDFQAILTQLKAKYPQVASHLLLERPWRGVTDEALAAQIRTDYLQLMGEAHLAKQNPLAQLLRAQGYAVEAHRGTPSLSARLPQRVILGIEQRPDVARIYLIEGKLVPLLDTAIPTARGNVVWDRGFKGTGVRIGIVEPGVVEVGHPSINVVAAREVVPAEHHTAGVASAAASHHSTYKGIAPEAEIVSAGVDGQGDQWDDVDDAILWAYNNGATIMNASFTSQTGERSDEMQWVDRVFDYYARHYNITFTVAAGNQEQGNHIGSPGKAYNVITVGGTDDKGDSAWSDDTMSSFSAWNNPKRDDGSYGDREKPEVVASATDLTLLNLNNGTWESSGTSFSSPQVAGLAALLCQRNSELCNAPQAMKAIIMASAVHNIDGPSNITTTQDLKDGAGAIDAALADTTAITGFADSWGYPYPACERPCWWSNSIYNYLPGDPPHFPVGSYRYYRFQASEGERIRVALTWTSHPAGPGSNYWQDPLETDLDLRIYDPYWEELDAIGGYSASNDNNYELVEFTAPRTGEYKIGVYKAQSQEVANWLGLAWTKEATYLPDVKANFNGWTSDITIRNDGARPQDIRVTFFDPGGFYPTSHGHIRYFGVPPNAVKTYRVSRYGFSEPYWGHAIVSASESVSVIVKTQNRENGENNITAYNGILPEGATGDPGWEQTGTQLYAPMVKRNWVNRWSEIYVMNVGTSATDVHVLYYGDYPYTHDGGTLGVEPGQRVAFSPEGHSWQNLHSAYITSANPPQPLAAVVMEYAGPPSGNKPDRTTHNVFRQGQPTLFAPLVKRDWGDPKQKTGLTIQNVGDFAADVTVKYYKRDGTVAKELDQNYNDTYPQGCLNDLPAKYWCVVYNPQDLEDPNTPGMFLGSAVVSATRTDGFTETDVVGMVHEASDFDPDTGAQRFLTHLMALADDSTAIYAPRQGRLWSEDGTWWNAAFMIMNVGDGPTAVTVRFYNEDGSLRDTKTQPLLNRYAGFSTWGMMPQGFKGSAVATAGQPIVAEVNLANYGSGDTGSSFNGANR